MARQWTRVCKMCSERFVPPTISNGTHGQIISPRQTCSTTCAAKLTQSSNKYWAHEEEQMLLDLAGSSPKEQILRVFKKYALKHDQLPRSWSAIRSHAHKLGVSLDPEVDFLVIPKIARRLGIGTSRVKYWTKIGLKASFETKTRKYISEKELSRFASKHPDRFGGIKYENLIQVIEDIDLCRFIVLNYPNRVDYSIKPARRIICVDTKNNTKRIYNSISAAKKDKSLYLSNRSIERCLKLKVEACGYRFEYFD